MAPVHPVHQLAEKEPKSHATVAWAPSLTNQTARCGVTESACQARRRLPSPNQSPTPTLHRNPSPPSFSSGSTTGLAAPPRRIRIRRGRSRSRLLPFTARHDPPPALRLRPEPVRGRARPPALPRGRRHGERRRQRAGASAGGGRAAGARAVPGRRVLRLPGAHPRPSRSISWAV
jgi:hypothetical protein